MAILRPFQAFAVCLLIPIFTGTSFAAAGPQKIFAVISKVDGSGTAKVRRVAGTESVVGDQMEIYAGDRIITDDSSTVEIVLHDGTLIRVGIRSEFKLSEVAQKKGALTWVFGLAGGTIRSLIEKSPDGKTVKVRVNTPAGTMGVRGTEITLEHRKESGITTLFTLEGKVEFGAPNCVKANSCIEVGAGKFSSIKMGDSKPSAAASFTMKDILGLAAGGPGSTSSANAVGGGNKDNIEAERLALFQGVSRTNAGLLANMNEADLAKTVKAAQDQLAAAQDKLLGRSEETRLAMYAAMKEGTFDNFNKIGEAYIVAREGKSGLSELEATNLGPIGVNKFALGKAIVQSGTFSKDQSGNNIITAVRTSNSAKVAQLAANSLSNLDIEALVNKNSASLAQATSWANALNAKAVKTSAAAGAATATESSTASSTQTVSQDPVVKSLASYTPVTNRLNEYDSYVAMANSATTSTCDLLCSIAKLFSGTNTRLVSTTATSTSTSAALSSTVLCSNPVTTCTYTPCNTTMGKICKQTKVCRKICK